MLGVVLAVERVVDAVAALERAGGLEGVVLGLLERVEGGARQRLTALALAGELSGALAHLALFVGVVLELGGLVLRGLLAKLRDLLLGPLHLRLEQLPEAS